MKWAWDVAFGMGFVVVILRSHTSKWQLGRNIFVVLDCERGGKYKQYRKDLQITVIGTRGVWVRGGEEGGNKRCLWHRRKGRRS